MVNELNALEGKIARVALLCQTLRAENGRLRQQLAAAETQRMDLASRMDTARGRIETLVQQLPESKF